VKVNNSCDWSPPRQQGLWLTPLLALRASIHGGNSDGFLEFHDVDMKQFSLGAVIAAFSALGWGFSRVGPPFFRIALLEFPT
jgi:hypothetical protein